MKDKKGFQNIVLITQIGFSIVTPILIGVFLGKIVDKWLNTQGIFTIIFIILGAITGFMNLFKMSTKNRRK